MSLIGNLFLHLFTGVMLLIVGLICKSVPVKKINYIMGYRTSRSMKNQDTWKEANTFFPNIMIKMSAPTLILCFIGFILLNNETSILIGNTLPLIMMFYVIYATEKHLKKNFDGDGNRIDRD